MGELAYLLISHVLLAPHTGHLWIVGVEGREGGREGGGGERGKKR